MTKVAGVILAGGRGQRMGTVEKSDLIFAGQPLLASLYQRVHNQAEDWALASDGFQPQSCPDPLQILDDPFEDKRGPLAGVLAAYGWATSLSPLPDFLLSVPVDTPFFPADFVARALATSDGAETVIIGQYGDDRYPTAALWPMGTLIGLGAWLETSDNLSIRHYMGQFTVKTLDYAASDPDANPFENINRPDDLTKLEQRR